MVAVQLYLMTTRPFKVGQIRTPIVIGAGGLLYMLAIAYFLNNGSLPVWVISPHRVVNFSFTMQMMVLPVSFVALALLYWYDSKNFRKFFRFRFRSPRKNDQWHLYGPVVLLAFSAGNMLMMLMSMSVGKGVFNEKFVSLLPLVLLLSITNAWSEEIFSRLVIVAGLDGKIKPDIICLVSGLLFGLAHIEGTPGGFFGIIVTGALGWLLAKSVIETRAIGWALLIHFILDVIIFGAGAMIIAHGEV